jgi:DNA-binding HxlR family transcriptional regulator
MSYLIIFLENHMFDVANPYNLNCPSRDVLQLIGGKWTILILCCLQQGPVRTGELMRSIGGVSQKMLTQTLREMEINGLVERISYPQVPPKVEYKLTVLGSSLSELARALEQWVVIHYPQIMEQRNLSLHSSTQSLTELSR